MQLSVWRRGFGLLSHPNDDWKIQPGKWIQIWLKQRMPGFDPGTSRSWVRRSTDWDTRLPCLYAFIHLSDQLCSYLSASLAGFRCLRSFVSLCVCVSVRQYACNPPCQATTFAISSLDGSIVITLSEKILWTKKTHFDVFTYFRFYLSAKFNTAVFQHDFN